MGYCFMTLSKVHTMGELAAKYNHNYRTAEVLNADPSLRHLNSELIELPENNDGTKMNYNDFFKSRIEQLDYYKSHSIRKNAVLAIEVVTTFSRQDKIPIEEWKQKNVEWLQKEFNKAGDGKNNIASVVYHADENGNVHCHAMVIPIDSNNKLSARYYTDGSRKLTELQTSYANDMKEFGLQRGLEGGTAKHRDIRKYYADLNNALKIPEPGASESAIEYHKRVLNEVQTLQATIMRERDEAFIRQRRKMDEERILQRKTLARELQTAQKIQNIKLEKLEHSIETKEQDLSKLNSQIDSLSKQLQSYGDPNEILYKAASFDRLQSCMQYIEEQYPEKYKGYQEAIDEMMSRFELYEDKDK